MKKAPPHIVGDAFSGEIGEVKVRVTQLRVAHPFPLGQSHLNFVITQTSAYEPIRSIRENWMSELSASGNLETAHTHQFRRSNLDAIALPASSEPGIFLSEKITPYVAHGHIRLLQLPSTRCRRACF